MALISWISGTFYNNRHEKLTREGVFYILTTYATQARKVSLATAIILISMMTAS